MTRAPFLGSNFVAWHGQDSACLRPASRSPRSRYAFRLPCRRRPHRRSAHGCLHERFGSNRKSNTRLSRDPLRTILLRGSMAQAIVCGAAIGTASGVSGISSASPILINQSPACGLSMAWSSCPRAIDRGELMPTLSAIAAFSAVRRPTAGASPASVVASVGRAGRMLGAYYRHGAESVRTFVSLTFIPEGLGLRAEKGYWPLSMIRIERKGRNPFSYALRIRRCYTVMK